jgi:hypothetical protein
VAAILRTTDYRAVGLYSSGMFVSSAAPQGN